MDKHLIKESASLVKRETYCGTKCVNLPVQAMTWDAKKATCAKCVAVAGLLPAKP